MTTKSKHMVFCGRCKHLDMGHAYRCSSQSWQPPVYSCNAQNWRQPTWLGPHDNFEYVDPGVKNANNDCVDFEPDIWERLFMRLQKLTRPKDHKPEEEHWVEVTEKCPTCNEYPYVFNGWHWCETCGPGDYFLGVDSWNNHCYDAMKDGQL